jgi:hypothetical protein
MVGNSWLTELGKVCPSSMQNPYPSLFSTVESHDTENKFVMVWSFRARRRFCVEAKVILGRLEAGATDRGRRTLQV